MDLDGVQKRWRNEMNADSSASIGAWDSVAQSYAQNSWANLEQDEFLCYLQRKIPLTGDMRVLDVGCGAGAYALALAPQVGEVVGVDFSPKMLEAARSRAADCQVENATFLERDWYRCPSEEFRGQFDLVFAHTTPAVADYNTLVKLMEASRRYCVLCKPARRTDLVFDKVREIAGQSRRAGDDSVVYAFAAIWGHGFQPEVSFQEALWESRRPLNEAETWYLGRLEGAGRLDSAARERVRAYLRAISQDGAVVEKTRTTLVNFFWEVKT